MVRQATDTAVSASISTPVWPETLTRAVTLMPGSLASGVSVDLDLGNGERMAQRDQFMRALGGHDAGNAGGAEHIALFRVAFADDVERLCAA